MMFDFRKIGTRFREPLAVRARFTGAGTSVPAANANCPDALASALTRSAVGTLSWNSAVQSGWVQAYSVEVAQAAGTTVGLKVVRTIAVDGTWPITLAMQVVYSANNANVDLTASEELVIYLDTSFGKP